MSEETIAAEGGLTRREMLKKAALVGAVAWTVPIVGSFNTPAFGSVTSPACDCDVNEPCSGQTPCGAGCACLPTIAGECFCHNISSCGALRSCTVQNDCDGLVGYQCANSCCVDAAGVPVSLCIPPCGVYAGPSDGGLTTAG